MAIARAVHDADATEVEGPHTGMTQLVEPVFVLSTVRSGSTLLQRVLASHPEVSTTSEPWVLLPFLYTLRTDGADAEYNHRLLVAGLEDFASNLPGGLDDYRSELRELAMRLYAKAASPGSRYFVDKTPRYGLVAPELRAVFPDAPLIFLWRNPLAVISSIIESWGDGAWNVFWFDVDLTTALPNLVDLFEGAGSDALALRYEDMVSDPDATWERAFGYLGLDVASVATRGEGMADLAGRFGDKTGVTKYSSISTQSMDRWKVTLQGRARKWWCRRYLRSMGRRRLAAMGYDLDELVASLDALPGSWRGFVRDVMRMGFGLVHRTGRRLALEHSTRRRLINAASLPCRTAGRLAKRMFGRGGATH